MLLMFSAYNLFINMKEVDDIYPNLHIEIVTNAN